jgi:hypothetical protein
MATTPGGLPYPAPTDPVANGADNIQALATGVDASRFKGAGVQSAAGVAMPTTGVVPTIEAFPAQDNTNAAGRMRIGFNPPFLAPPILCVFTANGSASAPVLDGNTVSATEAYVIIPGAVNATVRLHVIAVGWRAA